MARQSFYCAGRTPAITYARQALLDAGAAVADSPVWDTGHVLLDVPSFRPGLWEPHSLDTLLASLPGDVTIWGGKLEDPRLEGFSTVDLLEDEDYLVQNALITAQCTLPIIQSMTKHSWQDCPALIIGWGRIGKALARLLSELGCPVCVASGNPAGPEEQGFSGLPYEDMARRLPEFRCVINTAPKMVLADTGLCRDCVKIDLASVRGMAGEDVLWARALPGRYAPEKSGRLIAQTVLRLLKERKP